MEKINFVKMHGLGNDFVVIDKRFNNIEITRGLINKLSDRNSGAGCDQLITIEVAKQKGIHARIEIFNPNGDKAEACGNGTRCVAKLLFEESNLNEIQILSDAGILNAKKINSDNISVNLGKISTHWEKIPLSKEIDSLNIPINIDGFSNGVAVNIGNPHCVFFGEDIMNVDLNNIGSSIENNELFPKKTNVEIVEIINKRKIKMRVWERGAGLTLACGSGACASVYAGQLKNMLSSNVEIEVELERGSLFISIENEEAIMTGPAEISFYGNLEI
jgi:diaminopimelate epimerase